ncbi:unnamed protein product [Dicrocoelium dendriticum]|nr:unnamed protein product [Dicrocoelium dendriticum]
MRTQSLKIYVVDSADQDDSSCCLGVCKIPLLGLVDPARGQVDGVFEIIPLNEEPDSKKQFGTMNVRLFWSKPYNQSFTPHPEKRFVSSKENWNGHAEGTKQQPDTLANSGNSIEESICSEHKSNVSESGAVHIICPVRSSAIEKAGNQMDTEAMEIFIQLATEELELPGLADEEWTSTTPRPNVISYGASTEPTQKKKSNKVMAKQPCKSPLGSSKPVEMVDSSGTTSFSASVFEETNCSANAVGKNYYGARKLEQKRNDRTDGMPTPLPRHRDHGGQKGSRSGDKNAISDFRQSRVRHSTSSKKMDEDSVMNTKGRTIAKCSEIDENHVRIRLHRVEFAELPDQMKNNEHDKIFVEYFFLGSPEPFETSSAPLLALNTDLGATIFVAELEYEKSFSVDPAENFERRQHLATYLWSQDPNSDKLAFTIVTDPAVTQAAECEEVGVARVTIRDILTAKRDMEHIIIPIFSVDTRHSENNPGEEIGSITVSIHCLAALEAIKKEMQELTVATA